MIGPLSYVGGKNRFAKQIIATFPEHTTYVEPFAGGAQVFFHKPRSEVEVLNDLDGEIVNFFRVCQWHHEELIRHLRFSLVSRKLYGLLTATSPASLTDVQRAARFFYLQKNSFGGRVVRQNYHFSVIKTSNYNPDRLAEILQKTHERLQKVQIESLPYEKILKAYDRPTTLFYLDPPYWGRDLYRFNFTEADFKALAERLAQVTGRFILSLNDVPQVRQIFQAFHIVRFEAAYSSQKKAGERYGELLISNFGPLGAKADAA